MSFETYKIIHIISLLLFTASIGVSLLGGVKVKGLHISGMIGGVFILIAGMGLLARKYPGQAWPTWVWVKLVIWLVLLAGSEIMAKRLKDKRGLALSGLLGLMFVAVFLAVLKPF